MFYSGKDVAGNYYGSVLPAHRKKGVATAMTIKRMKMARDQGHNTVVAQCLDSSAGLYKRLGFQKTGMFTLFT